MSDRVSRQRGPTGMPIRFYCPFCDRLLGIAQRKGGAVVTCPSCRGKVRVPIPDASSEPVPQPLPSPAGQEVVLSSAQVAALLLALLLMLGLSFAAGLLVGALG